MPGSTQLRRHARRWLLQLLKSSLLRGSIEQGVAVHYLVRDIMLLRAEAADGGLLAMQREALRLLLDSFEAHQHEAEALHVAAAAKPAKPANGSGLAVGCAPCREGSSALSSASASVSPAA